MSAPAAPASMAIAAAQCVVTPDVAKNGAAIRHAATRAAARGARLVVACEGALTGYAKAEISDWRNVDWREVARQADAIADCAARLGIDIAYGAAHQVEGEASPRNAVTIARGDRGASLRYDKRVLSYTERHGWYAPGGEPTLLDIGGWTFGLALCIEVQFPPLFAQYRRLGADAVLFPAYAADPMFALLARAHAVTNSLWIAMATPVSGSVRLPSAIFGPDGSVLRQAMRKRAGLAVATLDRDDPRFDVALNKARPFRRAVEAEVEALTRMKATI